MTIIGKEHIGCTIRRGVFLGVLISFNEGFAFPIEISGKDGRFLQSSDNDGSWEVVSWRGATGGVLTKDDIGKFVSRKDQKNKNGQSLLNGYGKVLAVINSVDPSRVDGYVVLDTNKSTNFTNLNWTVKDMLTEADIGKTVTRKNFTDANGRTYVDASGVATKIDDGDVQIGESSYKNKGFKVVEPQESYLSFAEAFEQSEKTGTEFHRIGSPDELLSVGYGHVWDHSRSEPLKVELSHLKAKYQMYEPKTVTITEAKLRRILTQGCVLGTATTVDFEKMFEIVKQNLGL